VGHELASHLQAADQQPHVVRLVAVALQLVLQRRERLQNGRKPRVSPEQICVDFGASALLLGFSVGASSAGAKVAFIVHRAGVCLLFAGSS
jgi:hypothetical protein